MEKKQEKLLIEFLKLIEKRSSLRKEEFLKLQKKYLQTKDGLFSKTQVMTVYKRLAGTHGLRPFDKKVINLLKKRPVRTSSGVAPVTVLTKPFPCPGNCIFCPSDVRMPKSYLSDEPGAQRAERNYFDPYLQTYSRVEALDNMGHSIDKIELIVLGGTWSFYPETYQLWFIKECFRALNDYKQKDDRKRIEEKYQKLTQLLEEEEYLPLTSDPEVNKQRFESQQPEGIDLKEKYNQLIQNLYILPEKALGIDQAQTASWEELETEHQKNETSKARSVGLVVESRPDNISEEEVIRMRRLGATKVQIGVQSLNDEVLKMNQRGHGVAATAKAFALLRQTGFKIHAHWMANLYGSNVEKDKDDYLKLFNDLNFKPDELKIYPCSLIKSAELMQYYKKGLWKPYSQEELLDVVSFTLKNTPVYCRLTRVLRDIPSPDIVVGNKRTNLRQIVTDDMDKKGDQSQDIRAREIRSAEFDPEKIEYSEIDYQTTVSEEKFMQYEVEVGENQATAPANKKLLAFLRLSLPTQDNFIEKLKDCAMIREIHVYGVAVGVGKEAKGRAQHLGIGKKLIEKAKKIAQEKGYKKLAVISAVGTREYYRKRGFSDGRLYQFLDL